VRGAPARAPEGRQVIAFGIAKATTARLTEQTIFTEFRQMIGTPEYMSPEQAGESSEDADTRTDVYSTGVLLYELITGTTPFDPKELRSAAFGEVQRIIREVDPPKPSTRIGSATDTIATVAAERGSEPRRLGTTIRGELDWIVMKALEKDRARRYDSTGSMARDIRRYLDGEAIDAAPPGAAYRARKFVRRHRGPVTAAALLGIALVAGLVGTTLGFVNAERQRGEAVRQRDIATSEKERADAKAAEALAAEALATRNAYTANMLSACDALAESHHERAASFLDAAPEALRGWEWNVLRARLDLSTHTVAAPTDGDVGQHDAMMPHPDGRSFFTVRAYEAEAAQRWETRTGTLLASFEHPMGAQRAASARAWFRVAPDGGALHGWSSTGGAEPIHVSTWDLRTGERVRATTVVPGEALTSPPVLSPDGALLALSRQDRLWLLEVETGRTVVSTRVGFGIAHREFSPDGTRLAVGDGRGHLEVRDGRTLDDPVVLDGHRNLAGSFFFTGDGRWLASSSLDQTTRIWDLAATPPTAIVLEHPQSAGAAFISPDAMRAVTFCGDGAIRVWDARTGALQTRFTADALVGGTVTLMPDGRNIAARHRDGTVRFWDTTADATVRLRGHRGLLTGAAFAETPGLVVSVGWDGWTGVPGCIRIWDADTGDPVATLGRPGEIARWLAVAPDGRRAALTVSPRAAPNVPADAVRTAHVKIIDLETGHVTQVETHPHGMVFDPTGALIACSGFNRMEIRTAADGSVASARELGFMGKEVTIRGWSPDGRVIACDTRTLEPGPDDVEVEHLVLDAATLETVHRFEHGTPLFGSDGTRVFERSPEGVLRVYDTGTWALVDTVDVLELGRFGFVPSPDGTRSATPIGGTGEILVWNGVTYDAVARFNEGGFVSATSWSADGTRLLGACGRTVRVWDATPVRERVRLREASRAARTIVEPIVDRLFETLDDPTEVLARLDEDASLSPVQIRVARQEVLRRGLARNGAEMVGSTGP
jgi:WD40 repeat protein